MDHKKILVAVALITIAIVIVYDNHHLEPEITSFSSAYNELKEDYFISENSKSGFSADNNIVFNDFIILTQNGERKFIYFLHNRAREYHYEIIDGELIFVNIKDENHDLICSNDCTWIYKIEEFYIRGRIINELEKYY